MDDATATGPQHEALAYFLGTWDVEMQMRLTDTPSDPFRGTGTYEWIFEGRWLASRVQVPMVGATYESFSILGYDTFAKSHVVATVSGMDTALNVARGAIVDPEGQVTAVYGFLDEYATGELHKPFKVVTRIVDDDHHTVEIWDLGTGEAGVQVVELRYTRR